MLLLKEEPVLVLLDTLSIATIVAHVQVYILYELYCPIAQDLFVHVDNDKVKLGCLTLSYGKVFYFSYLIK